MRAGSLLHGHTEISLYVLDGYGNIEHAFCCHAMSQAFAQFNAVFPPLSHAP